jgi:molybdopterin converting factor small subunit
MQVRVRLFATLRKYLPAGHPSDALQLTLPDGATAGDVVARLGIPAEHAKMIVSNNEQLDVTSPLCDGQEVSLFPPLAGGREAPVGAREQE